MPTTKDNKPINEDRVYHVLRKYSADTPIVGKLWETVRATCVRAPGTSRFQRFGAANFYEFNATPDNVFKNKRAANREATRSMTETKIQLIGGLDEVHEAIQKVM